MNQEFKKLSNNARKSILTGSIAASLIGIGIIFIAWKIIFSFNIPAEAEKIINGIIIFLIFVMIIEPILSATIGFNHRRYRINEESVEYRKGIFFVNQTIVPVRRIQQVETSEGPINRLFSIADIEIITAGGDLTIENLDKDLAEELSKKLKTMINEFAKEMPHGN